MAEYRTLHTKIWQDEWFCELEPDAKLLFVYFVTNRAASVAGIYKLPLKFVGFETGMTLPRVNTLLKHFQQAGKVYHENGVIWVKNLRAYQTYQGKASEQVEKRIQKDIDEIPDGNLKRQYLAFYSNGHTPTIPTPHPVDTPTIPTPETETETEKDTSAGAVAPDMPQTPPEPPRVDNTTQAIGELEKHFSAITHLPVPPRRSETDKSSASIRWWQPLRHIFELTGNVEETKGLMSAALARMRSSEKKLTVSAPQSIEKTALAIYSERESGPSPGPEPKGFAGIRAYTEKRGLNGNGA